MLQLFHGDAAQQWREVPLADTRTLLGAVWNPEKRNRKALADLVRGLIRATSAIDRDRQSHIQYTVPYLMLLSYLSGSPVPTDPQRAALIQRTSALLRPATRRRTMCGVVLASGD
jgi:hypothetical protein